MNRSLRRDILLSVAISAAAVLPMIQSGSAEGEGDGLVAEQEPPAFARAARDDAAAARDRAQEAGEDEPDTAIAKAVTSPPRT